MCRARPVCENTPMDPGSTREDSPGTEVSSENERNLKTFVCVLATLAAALAASWVYSFGVTSDARFLVGGGTFAVLLLLFDLFPVRVSERWEVSALDVGLVVAIVLMGPVWTAVAALPCAALAGGRDPLRTAYEASRNTVEIFIAGSVFSFAAKPLLLETSAPAQPTPVVYATFIVAIVLLVVNHASDAALLKAKYGQPLAETWEELMRPYLSADAANALTSALAVLALLVYGPAAAVAAVGGAIGGQVMVYRSREKEGENRRLKQEIASLRRSLAGAGTTFGTLAMGALGRKDGRADRHAAATAVYAEDLARELKLEEERVGMVRMAGLLHDIGLLSLPDEILLRDKKPNSVAQSKIAEHPVIGQRALAAVPEFGEMANWIRWHHERPDGRGYPDKLRGAWIPLEAKILAVAQAYATMILDGPRHPGLSPQKARELLVAGIGTEFDAMVTIAFLRVLETETEGYRSADDHRFILSGPDTPLVTDSASGD